MKTRLLLAAAVLGTAVQLPADDRCDELGDTLKQFVTGVRLCEANECDGTLWLKKIQTQPDMTLTGLDVVYVRKDRSEFRKRLVFPGPSPIGEFFEARAAQSVMGVKEILITHRMGNAIACPFVLYRSGNRLTYRRLAASQARAYGWVCGTASLTALAKAAK